MRLLQRFFQSLIWKVLVVCLLASLFVSLYYFLGAVNFSMNYVLSATSEFGQQQVADQVREVYSWGLVSLALLTLIVAAGIYDLVSSVQTTQKFRELTGVIEQFALGDHSRRFEGPMIGDRHVRKLGTTFNYLANELEQTIEKLRSVDKERRDLIGALAHDLGTPLTSIRGYIDTIEMKVNTIEANELHSYLNIISKNTVVLTNLVQELLQLVRLDDPDVGIERQEVSMEEMIVDVMDLFRPIAIDKEISFELSGDTEGSKVFGDPRLLERVVANLLDNALKFTNLGGQVRVSLSSISPSMLEIKVRDTGSGIRDCDIPRVFDQFYRGSKARENVGRGSGLGLSIAKRIVVRHGGEIEIRSAEGEGTVVRVLLPLLLVS